MLRGMTTASLWLVALMAALPCRAQDEGASAGEGTVEPAPAPVQERTLEPEAEEAALRDAAIQLFLERCGVDPDSAEARNTDTHWDMLVRLGYTPAHILELAQDLPDSCAYTSFRSAILASDHGVADRTLEELDQITSVVQSKPPEEADSEPAETEISVAMDNSFDAPWRQSLRDQIRRYKLGWIVPAAIVDGFCRSFLILAGPSLEGNALIPYLTVGIHGGICMLVAQATLDTIRGWVDRAPDAHTLEYKLELEATLAFVASAIFFGIGGTAFTMYNATFGPFPFFVGISAFVIAFPILHGAITLAVMENHAEEERTGASLSASRRPRRGPRLVAVSPFGVSGVW